MADTAISNGSVLLTSNGHTNGHANGHANGNTNGTTKPVSEGPEKTPYKRQIVWRNIALMTLLHTLAFYGVYHYFFTAKWQSLFFTNFTTVLFGLGVTCGAHRLWSHRSYEARLPLRIFLMILNSASLQNDILEWSRDHRVHHKFSGKS